MSPRRRTDPDAERGIHRSASPRRRGNRLFYVAVEGEATEPDYLSYLNREFGAAHHFLIHPLFRRNGMSPSHVVARALEHADEAKDERVQLWALFDRDAHVDIPRALREARRGGVRVAVSYPAFELWLLLHFVDVSGRSGGSSRIITQKLRRCTGFTTYGAHHDKSLTGLRIRALAGRHDDAVNRARRLVDDCPTGECSAKEGHAPHCDPLHRDPSTDVWRLLVELGVVAS